MKKFALWLNSNRVAIVFTAALLCIGGFYMYVKLPKDVFPNSEFPRFQVIADIGFASLETTEINVTRPLEEALKTVPGTLEVRSVTERGASTIDVFLKWGTDLNRAQQYIQSRIDQTRVLLPSNASIELIRMNTSAYPMSEYGVWSDTLTLKELYSTIRYSAVPRLIGAEGVARLDVIGGKEPEIWVKLNSKKLASYNIDAASIENALSDINNISFIGTVTNSDKTYFAVGGSRLDGPESIGEVVIASRMGKPVMLKDVAEIVEGHAEVRRLVTINGHKGLFIDVLKQNEADGLTLSKDLDARFEALKKESNGRLNFVKWDLSDFVRESISGIIKDIIVGILIILAIIYYVMVRIRYSLPIMIIMPLVLVTEFLALKAMGMTINIMTLGGLSAALGIIADNAIVITENYVRFRAEKSPEPLAESMSYIVPITIWATVVSIVVFVPLNLLSATPGLFFRPLALTLASTIVISLIMAVTLLPVLIHYFIELHLNPSVEERERRVFVWLKKFYLRFIKWSLEHRKVAAAAVLPLMIAGFFVFTRIPTGFLPEWDEGDIVFDYNATSGMSLDAVDKMVKKAEKIIAETAETEVFIRKTGTHLGTPFAPPTRGEVVILLKKDRDRSTAEVMDELRVKIEKSLPDLETDFHQILPDRLGDLTGNLKPIVVTVIGKDLDKVWAAARQVKLKLEKIDGLNGVLIDLPAAQKEIHVIPNQRQLSLLGLSSFDAFRYSGLALYGNTATEVARGIEMIPVRVMYAGDFRTDPKSLVNIPVYTPNGGVLPLSKLVTFTSAQQVPEVSHKNGSVAISVAAELGNRALGDVVKDVQKSLVGISSPDYTIELEGNYKQQQKSFSELMLVLLLSVVLILALLLYIFESYLTSLAVFAGTLASTSFVVFGLKLSGVEFDVSSFTGMITVMGIVVNNGILVIAFAERAKAAGEETFAAVLSACSLRFRPVLITNLAAIAGFLPMALNIGKGGEVLRPFSVAMISGLLGSMFFSLVVIPVFYVILHRADYVPGKIVSSKG